MLFLLALKKTSFVFTVYLMNHIFQTSVHLVRNNGMHNHEVNLIGCVNILTKSEAVSQSFLY